MGLFQQRYTLTVNPERPVRAREFVYRKSVLEPVTLSAQVVPERRTGRVVEGNWRYDHPPAPPLRFTEHVDVLVRERDWLEHGVLRSWCVSVWLLHNPYTLAQRDRLHGQFEFKHLAGLDHHAEREQHKLNLLRSV